MLFLRGKATCVGCRPLNNNVNCNSYYLRTGSMKFRKTSIDNSEYSRRCVDLNDDMKHVRIFNHSS
jgi:hypothetical protein